MRDVIDLPEKQNVASDEKIFVLGGDAPSSLLKGYHDLSRVAYIASMTQSRALVDFASRWHDIRKPIVTSKVFKIEGIAKKYYPLPVPSGFDAVDKLESVVGSVESQDNLSEGSFWNILASEFMRHGRSFARKITDEFKSITANSYIVESRTRDLDEVSRVPGGIEIAVVQKGVPEETLDRLWNTRGLMDVIDVVDDEKVLDNWSLRLSEWSKYEFDPRKIDWNVAEKFLSARNKVVALYTINSVMDSFSRRLRGLDNKIHPYDPEWRQQTAEEKREIERWTEPVEAEIGTTIKRRNEFIERVKLSKNPAVREAVLDIIDDEKLNRIAAVKMQGGSIPREMDSIPNNVLTMKERVDDTCTFLERATGMSGVKSDDPWIERNKKRAEEMIAFYRPCRERRKERERRKGR
jgi:hypothetical protein